MDTAVNAADETARDYEAVRALIYATVRDYRRGHGGDLEEMIGEANLAFLKGRLKYRPEASALTTWTRHVVTRALQTADRRRARRHAVRPTVPLTGDVPDRRRASVAEVLEEVTRDARLAALAVLEPPLDVKINARTCGGGEGSVPSLRMALKEYLGDLGWSAARVCDVFQELNEVFG